MNGYLSSRIIKICENQSGEGRSIKIGRDNDLLKVGFAKMSKWDVKRSSRTHAYAPKGKFGKYPPPPSESAEMWK